MSRLRMRIAPLALATTAVRTGCRAAGGTARTVLQAYSAADGHLRWSVELGPTDGATEPMIVGDTVIVGRPGLAAGYALEDGHLRWTVPGAASLPDAVTGDLAVFSRSGHLEARRADTGAVAWTRDTTGE